MEKTLKSQIPIKILTTANSNGLNKSSVVLIKANQIDTEKLVGLAEKANAKIHALVNYSGASDVLNLLQNLSDQGFVEGSYVFINIEDVGNINEIQSIYSNLRQGGYYVGLVNTVKGFASLDEDDVKNISFYKMIDQNGDNSITVGDADGYINGLNIDLTGKLNKQPITRKERNTYTNVDVNTDSKGWVGIGQDTVLGGGKGFGYSTMGNDFNTVISPKGIIFRRPDAERMWELLKPKQQAEVSELLDHTVADEIKNQLPGLEKARQQADEAVKFAESAIAASKVNSDAIVAQSEAISEAKSAMDSATAEIQQTAANAASDAAKIRANSTQITQNKQAIALKADQSSVDNLSGEVSQNKAQLKVQADQISSKVSSEDFKTLDNKVGGAIAQIDKNTTAIDQTNKQISLKADQTEVDKIKGIASQNSSRLDVMAGQISSKVTSTDVDNIVDGKGYATTSTVQSLVDQKAGTLRDTITELDRKIGDNHSDSIKRIQSLTASIDGLQSRVTNYQNDTSSKYTQLSNLMQSKVGTADFEQLKRSVDMQTLDSADINNMKTNGHYFVHNLTNSPIAGWVYVDVTGNGNNRIRQDVYQDNGIQHKYRRWVDTHWTGWEEGATYTEITQLQDALNLRVQKGELLSQINLTAGNTLIQSNKIYLDSSSTVFSGKAFIPSAAIVSLDADKINTGTLNTQMVSIGDDQTRLWARSNYLYLTGKDQGDAYNMRIGGDKIEFVTTEIPNNAPYLDGITPMYQIAYDGDTKSRLKIRSFNRLTGSNEFPIEMYDSVNISKDEIDLAANNQMKLSIRDDGVHVRRSLFFENVGGTGAFGGFTRADNSNIVEFSSGDNNGENFRIDCGARFMQYVYINGNARAQQWLTNSALSKKMNIRKLDLQTALNKIRQDDQYLYEYKRNVAQGIHDPQASFIIDDVHDVAHYSVPREFIDNTGKYREPSVELAYLIAAFQAIDKQVQAQQAEIKILKERLQHE